MIKHRRIPIVLLSLMAGGVMLLASSCGGGGPPPAPSPETISPPAATPSPPPETISPPATIPSPPSTPPQTPGNPVARGELIFQKTAGDMGCQYCHGTDAKGLVGPNIRGDDAGKIQFALGKVEAMAFIYLTKEEIQDVAAYLQSLESQP